ncbi:MAG: hypothetical protein V1802_02520 [Candidatus Aenigmatarchaeota archaeon]
MEEEYELIPLNPIRKLEKRVEKVERNALNGEVVSELMNIVKTNQQVVDNMAKANNSLVTRVSELADTVDKLIVKVDNFLEKIEVEGETQPEAAPSEDRVSKLEKRVNALLLSTMTKRRAVTKV